MNASWTKVRTLYLLEAIFVQFADLLMLFF